MKHRVGMQCWAQFAPSRDDLVEGLVRCVALLASALPVAVKHIGTEDVETQLEFWRDFTDFDRQTDLSINGMDALSKTLSEWHEVIDLRRQIKVGPLAGEDGA